MVEREGAQVLVEPIATWVAYLMYQAKAHAIAKWPVNRPHRDPKWYELKKNFANYIGLRKKLWGIGAGERMWGFFYHRTAKHMGGITHHLAPQAELADLAHPFYNQFARGGEGHLEVGKNVYYTMHKLCHMVLALKPFGCMPSSQSDGVQSAVINKFKDMISSCRSRRPARVKSMRTAVSRWRSARRRSRPRQSSKNASNRPARP
jgi:hypothetical protein